MKKSRVTDDNEMVEDWLRMNLAFLSKMVRVVCSFLSLLIFLPHYIYVGSGFILRAMSKHESEVYVQRKSSKIRAFLQIWQKLLNTKNTNDMGCHVFRGLLFILFSSLTYLTGMVANADDTSCYDASDIGLNYSIIIPAQPPDLFPSPSRDHQVARWVDSGQGFYAIGTNITATVTDSWGPWGGSSTTQECQMKKCTSNEQNCYGTGDGLGKDGEEIAGVLGVPCRLTNGEGVYILIIPSGGEAIDPNQSMALAANPPANWRTIHLGPYCVNGICEIDTTYSCPDSSNQKRSCTSDGGVISGRLFVKILDSYYLDNEGQVTVKFTGGVVKLGFISLTLNIFSDVLSNASGDMLQTFLGDTRFTLIVRVLLVLYIALTGFVFSMGMVQYTSTELIVRIMKVALVGMLCSSDVASTYNFFTSYLMDLFQMVGESFSTVIATAIMEGTEASSMSINAHIMPGAGYLVMYDQMFDMLTSHAINAKILGLLFSSHFYYVILLYFLVVLLLLAILKALMLYCSSYFQFAMLVVIFPVLFTMILFKLTGSFFQSWLKYMSSTALTIIITTAVSGVMFLILQEQFGELFGYSVCWHCFWCIKVFGWQLLAFWEAGPEASSVLRFSVYLQTVLYALLFSVIFDKIPNFADSLGAVGKGFSGDIFAGAMKRWGNSTNSVINYLDRKADVLRKINAERGMGRLLDKKTSPGLLKDVYGVLSYAAQVKHRVSKYVRETKVADKFESYLSGENAGLNFIGDKTSELEKAHKEWKKALRKRLQKVVEKEKERTASKEKHKDNNDPNKR